MWEMWASGFSRDTRTLGSDVEEPGCIIIRSKTGLCVRRTDSDVSAGRGRSGKGGRKRFAPPSVKKRSSPASRRVDGRLRAKIPPNLTRAQPMPPSEQLARRFHKVAAARRGRFRRFTGVLRSSQEVPVLLCTSFLDWFRAPPPPPARWNWNSLAGGGPHFTRWPARPPQRSGGVPARTCRRGTTTGAGRGPGRGGWRGPCCWGRCSGWRAGSCRPRPPPAPAAAARPRTWEARQRAEAGAGAGAGAGEEVGSGGRRLPCSAQRTNGAHSVSGD